MKAAMIGLVLRHILGGVGAVLIERGIASSDEWNALGGGVLALVAVVASYYNKKRLIK